MSDRKKRRNLQRGRHAYMHELFTSEDVIKFYDISRNTLTNWTRYGLKFIPGPLRLFRGKELNEFHAEQYAKMRGVPLGPYEVRCFACKCVHSLLDGEIRVESGRAPNNFRVYALCEPTGKTTNKYFSCEGLEQLHKLRESNPRVQTRD